ncbi:glycoside hydrolase family 13 protein [Antrihabitans sp. YC2-6]|uniref:glycoside hydrolase family 13 protein n=1 Tax=Antrihabitans sp. YC2-6 TaxID=2799498 RepID=UPI0018F3BDE2|nr:glycoside hydrolase family 13 protein [Antrihabitans sp. YC2-6]MBJ8346762.1 glycoside hydrolase family 13 protein [Antrihabitans sp. YC2-6]
MDEVENAPAAVKASAHWWQKSVFYQVYPRSFADSNGDGIGDLEGIREKLGYLELLGVDAIWLCPVMRSPMADGGYDVSDPRDIDPMFGGVEALDGLVTEAHARRMRVIMDVVPNHTSDQHVWFQEALTAAPGSPARGRYIFREGRGADGAEPPNNWPSIFGGPAWTRITEPDGTPGQWYLHIFATEQPDLNWDNPEVFDDLAATLRFWLDRGVDGFRIDVAHGMAKPAELPDMSLANNRLLANNDDDLRFNNAGVHEIHRRIRKVLEEYPDAVAVGEVWVDDNERFGEYVRPDELHLAFNFRLAEVEFAAEAVREAVENSMSAVATVGGTPTWTLSNHDVAREVTRYGGGTVGVDRARAMALVELSLPGVTFIYNGSELGLPNVDDLPDSALQDPVWERSGRTERGRDGCRVPLPWEGRQPPFAFTTGQPWLPIPPAWKSLTVEAQIEDYNSTFSLFRKALELRAIRPEFSGNDIDWYGSPKGCLVFRRTGGLICALNTTNAAIPLPPGEVLLATQPIEGRQLAANAAAWLV